MPPINTFQDPRLQAIADFLSIAQIDRMQAESDRRQERERQNQRLIMGVAAGAGALAAPALGLGAQVGSTMAGAPIMGATLGGTLQGAALGAQVGSQFAGGDVAGGIGTIAGGIGQGIQARQDIQQFGFSPTPLDKKEISKLAASVDLTTRQATTQAKQAGVGVGPYLTQLAQEQQDVRMQNAFEAQMAQREGVSPDDIRAQDPSGQNDFGAGLQVVESQNDKERLAFQEKQLDQRLSQTELFRSMSETHDLKPAPDSAQQALRYRNAVLSPAAGVDAEQRLGLLNRIVEEAENQPAELQWVRKPPPDPAQTAMSFFENMAPAIKQAEEMGLGSMTFSVDQDGKVRMGFSPEKQDSLIELPGGGSIPRGQFLNRLNENYALGVSTAREKDPDLGPIFNKAMDVTIDGLIATENLPQMYQERLEARQAERIRDASPREAAAELKSAVRESPNIETWPPEKVEQHRGDARVVFDFYVSLLEGGRQLDEKQQRELEIAKRILEQ